MNCPFCRAVNAQDAKRCVTCGQSFVRVGDAETLGPPGSPSPDAAETLGPRAAAADPAATPAAQDHATAAGVLTPPPTPTPSGFGSGSTPSTASITFTLGPGSDFGPRYRIEGRLGEGGMGVVYKAYDKELDRTVAIKLLRVGVAAEASAMQRFKQELLLASKVSHKNILRIHDLGDVGGIKFISMAYIEGEDLHAELKRSGRLAPDRIVRIARQLSAALDAAHAEGIVHRDLKPQNVLLDKNDNLYVSDFGLAKSLEAGAAGMTRSGEFLGTPKYMSPEQVEAKSVDHRSDLYSLGLMLYEMATGEVPFAGESLLQTMYQRVKQKPKNVKAVNPELPDYLARIIMRCLEKDPALRYQSAKEILADLDAERASRSMARSMQIALPRPSNRLWLMIGGGVLLLVVLAFAIPLARRLTLSRPAGIALTKAGVPALSEGKFLAVVPFRVLGDPNALGYIADGLVEGLSAKFFQLRDVRLTSPSAVAKLKKRDTIEAMARELGANLVVHGTVQGTAEKIRVVVNLENVADGRRLLSQDFSGVPQDLLTLEDQIYDKLSDALALKTTNEEKALAATRPTVNIEAYELYLKGRSAMRGSQDIRNVQAAIGYYEAALKKDARFALAYSGMADAGLVMYREKKDSFWAEKALAAAQHAERINPNLAEVRFSLGSVYGGTGKTAEAVAELKRALELAPNSDEGYRRLGNAYVARGQKNEAIQAFQKAIEVNPYYWTNFNALGAAYIQLGDNEKALSAFRRVTELEPDNHVGHENMGLAYFRQGKWSDSLVPLQKALELQPKYDTYSNLGTAYFYLKRYDEATKMFEKAAEMNPNQEVVMGNLADAYRWSGQNEKALAAYDKAIALAYKELQVNPRRAATMGSLALYYAKKGESTHALDFIRRARSIDPNGVALIYVEAVVETLASRPEQALQLLQETFQKGYPVEEAKSDPELNSLQSNPEFQRLVKKLKGNAR